MVVLLSIVVVCFSLAVCVTTQSDPHAQQETMFYVSPDNSTFMADEAEGSVTKHFTCIAINAYDIIWLVNGSEKQGEDRTYKSVIRSTLRYNISVGESIQVVCRAKNNLNDTSIDSEPAVISVQTCICDSQNLPSDAELGANVSSISPITEVNPVAVLLGISVVANVVLVLTVIVLAIIYILSLRKKQGNTGKRVQSDGADIVEIDGPRRHNPQGKGASIRQRPVQRQ